MRPERLCLETEDTGEARTYHRPVPSLPTTPLERDILLAALLAGVAQLELLATSKSIDGSPEWHHLTYLLIFPAMALRRTSPLAAMAFAAAGLAAEPLIGPAQVATPYLCLLILLFSLGWHASLRVGVIGVLMTLGAGLVYDVTRREVLLADLVVNAVIIVLFWGAGHALRVNTDRRIRSELAAERSATVATLAERSRIAGDLHDSLAHALTLITLQAGSARERTDQPIAGEALAAIEQTGRAALADMNRFLALLGGPTAPEAPGICDLPGLVERVRSGGLDVRLDTAAGAVTTSVSTTVYRVVQEALTNVVRHSDARTARVVVHREGDVLVTRVSDDGAAVDARTNGSGQGLAGLAARVQGFEGTLTSGRNGRGWQVEARIPLAGTLP